MGNPLSTSDAPDLTDKSVRKIYIKDGQRTMPTSDGVMKVAADRSRKLFGNYKGGRYSTLTKR